MTDIFLGVIAVSVLAMAVVQVAVLVGAWRAAKQAGEAARRLEQEIKPMMANLQTMSADLARTSALVTTQVERLDQLTTSVARRVEETTVSLQASILTPVKDAFALLHGLRRVLSAFGATRRARDRDQPTDPRPAAPAPERPTATDDPDPFV